MRYEWTFSQEALLTLGTTVAAPFPWYPSKRLTVTCRLEHGRVAFEDAGVPNLALSSINPETIEAPTIDFIRRLAEERLGEDSGVWDDGEYVCVTHGGYLNNGPARANMSIADGALGVDRFRAAVMYVVAMGSRRRHD